MRNPFFALISRGLKPLLVIGAFAVLAGCFTVESGRIESTGEDNVLVSNYGWYLFHCIPLACGNANDDSFLPWVMFRNDVTMDKIQGRFFKHADSQKGKKAKNLSYMTHESVLLEIPGSNLPIPLPYILTYKEIQLSGVLTPEKEASK